MPSSSAYDAVATAIQQIVAVEFEEEGFTCRRDNLHESLGRHSVEVGVAPTEDVVRDNNAVVQETWVEVRFYDLWTDEISPDTIIDPTQITAYAERFRAAVRRAAATDPGTGQVWYFEVRRIAYPNDPTGNKSRFVATIRAFGNNAGLVETTE